MHSGIPEPTSLRLPLTKMAECYNVTYAKMIYVNGSDFVDANGTCYMPHNINSIYMLYVDTVV